MLPTPHTLYVKRLVSQDADVHGNPTTTYGTPAPLPAHFVAPAQSVEPYRENRDLLLTDRVVGAPKSDALPGRRDMVTWQGDDYTVQGEVDDWTDGPWEFPGAGVTFVIRRVEG